MNVVLAVTIATGFLVGGGVFAVVGGLQRGVPALATALDRLDAREAAVPDAGGTLLERLGNAVGHRGAPRGELAALLEMRGGSVIRHQGLKCVLALGGLIMPTLIGMVVILLGHPISPVPAVAGLVGAAVGWLIPGLALRRAAPAMRADLTETLFTYFDLVALERLANASASRAMYSASAVSDVPLFRRIHAALTRARMEHRSPHLELHRLADDLQLPALHDMADVMRLDEQGAALADVLRSRVRELRDEHLTAEKIRATEASERMTIWMTLPALLFGLAFLTPALLRLTL